MEIQDIQEVRAQTDENLLMELFKDNEICLYPEWTGTIERIENGERYIYQTDFDE